MKGTCVLLLPCEYKRSTMLGTYLNAAEFVDPALLQVSRELASYVSGDRISKWEVTDPQDQI